MGLFINQKDNRSQLQERLAAELQERTRARAEQRPDGIDDSEFIRNTKTTTSLAWVWILIAIFIVGLLVWLTVSLL